MSKLWSGRFAASGAALLDEFNASLPFDKKLYEEDIKGSIAHATMLAKQGILTQDEADQIARGLLQIKKGSKREYLFLILPMKIFICLLKRG